MSFIKERTIIMAIAVAKAENRIKNIIITFCHYAKQHTCNKSKYIAEIKYFINKSSNSNP